jgi:hypothetical protein
MRNTDWLNGRGIGYTLLIRHRSVKRASGLAKRCCQAVLPSRRDFSFDAADV